MNTWRAAAFRRVPPQSGQAWLLRNFVSSSRTRLDSVSRIAALEIRKHAFETVQLLDLHAARDFRRRTRSSPCRCRTARLSAVSAAADRTAFRYQIVMRREALDHLVVIGRLAVPASNGATRQRQGGFTTTRSGSKNCLTPRPSQPGQAPVGLLKENRRGSSSVRL